MSRLDSFIRRLHAQRACLEQAALLIHAVPGPVLELGLGNGRTYDHLRELLPHREIFVFDRQIAAHPDCKPDAQHIILGDIRETLPLADQRIGTPVAFAHVDCGTGDKELNAALAFAIANKLAPLMSPQGVVASDQAMSQPMWKSLPLPEGVTQGRYYMYRCG